MLEEKGIGSVGNYYGGVVVKEENGKFLWTVKDVSGFVWEEIPQYLYDALLRFETERQKDKR